MGLMNQRTLISTLKWTIITGILATLFAQFFVYSGFFFPYIFTKTIFFRIIVEIILFAYLFLVSLEPAYKFKSSKISWAIFIYIGIVLATSIIGVNFSRSFFGTVERSEGIMTILHIIALFVISVGTLKNKKDWLLVFDVAFFAGLLQGGYSLLQKLDVETFLGIQVLNAGGRVQGSIGNASFLAGLLVLTIFIGCLLFWQKKELNQRIYYGIGLTFLLYILYCSQTRGAILGLLGGIVLFAILAIFFSKNKKLKVGLSSGILILIITSVVVWNCRKQDWVKNSGTLNKLTSISFEDVSTEARLLGWQGAIKGWVEKPKYFLFGYGYENYNIPFNKYFNPKIFRDAGSQLWFDRAHNIVLDVALTSGIIGLIAYLSIFVAVLWSLYQLYKKDKEKLYLYLLIVSGLAAYFAQNLFVFDTLPTYILFYLILGYITFLYSNSQPLTPAEEIKKKDRIEIGVFGSGILIVILSVVVYSINIFPAIANYNINLAFRYASNGNNANNNYELILNKFDQLLQAGGKTEKELKNSQDIWNNRARTNYAEAISYFDKAIAYGTYQNREFREKYAESVLSFYKKKCFEGDEDDVDTYLGKILTEVDKNMTEYPLDIQEYSYALTVYNMVFPYFPERLNMVFELGEKSIELSKDRPQIYYELGKAKISQKKYEEGITYFQKAIDLNPNTSESYWNLLVSYAQAGKKEEAAATIEKIKEMDGINFEEPSDLNRLVSIFTSTKDYENLAWVYDNLIELQSLTVDHYIKAAIINRELRNYAKAKEYMSKAMELDKTIISKGEAFLATLE